MNKKILVAVMVAAIFLAGFWLSNDVEEILFDQIPYNYTGHAWVPPNSPDEGSLGGYYRIYGKGRDFNFFLVLPGAEDAEDPLCYTKEGLKGTGQIYRIEITYNTLHALLFRDFKRAMFQTKFSGRYNMSCAAWNGTGTFSNNGTNFPGTFKITGPATDWEGTFRMVPETNRIAVMADYIHYPHNQKSPETIRKVQKTYYL